MLSELEDRILRLRKALSKKELDAGAETIRTHLTQLQRQLDRFRRYYNLVRPHRAIDRRTPAQAYAVRPKATHSKPLATPHYRVRRDRVDDGGGITIRYDSRRTTSAWAANTATNASWP